MLRNLIFDWAGTLAEESHPLFRPTRNPELLLEEMRERSHLLFDPFVEFDGAPIVRLKPHALEFLRFCRATQRRMFLLGDASQLNIAHFFEGLFSDAPEQIANILAEEELLAAETAFVSNNAQALTGARAAGVMTIATDAQLRADVVVRDLAVLQSLLETVPPDDEIRIEELELFVHVGVPEAERAEAQRLVLSATLQPRHTFDELDDELSCTVDYAAVCAEMREFVRQRKDKLIETLADAMAEHLLDHFDLQRVELELRKFVLPETRFVAVRLARAAPVPA